VAQSTKLHGVAQILWTLIPIRAAGNCCGSNEAEHDVEAGGMIPDAQSIRVDYFCQTMSLFSASFSVSRFLVAWVVEPHDWLLGYYLCAWWVIPLSIEILCKRPNNRGCLLSRTQSSIYYQWFPHQAERAFLYCLLFILLLKQPKTKVVATEVDNSRSYTQGHRAQKRCQALSQPSTRCPYRN